jgi:outer membrane protein TolC
MLFFCPRSGEGRMLSLEEVMSKAIEHSHALRIASVDVEIREALLQEVRSQYYPRISVRLNNEYRHLFDSASEVVTIGDIVLAGEESTFQHSLVTNVHYPLYDFGVRAHEYRSAEKGLSAERHRAHSVLMEVKLSTVVAYAHALERTKQLDAAKRISGTRLEIWRCMELMHEAGLAGRNSVEEAALELARSVSGIEEARIAALEALAELSFLIGEDCTPDGSMLTELPETEAVHDPTGIESLPEIRFLEERIAQKEAEYRAAQRQLFPRLLIYGAYRLYGSDKSSFSQSFADMDQRDATVALAAEWNLFSGFGDMARIQRLKKEAERLVLEREQRIAKHQQELQTTYATIRLLGQSSIEERGRSIAELEDMNRRLSSEGIVDRIAFLNRHIESVQHQLELDQRQIQQRVAGLKANLWREASE